MCAPPNYNSNNADATDADAAGTPPRVCRVLIAGAGPAGLLLHALLHHRNKKSSSASGVTYQVTIVDGREDLGQCTREELASNHRSWMIGLAGHGLEAVRSVPDLWEGYLSEGVGVKLERASITIGGRKISMGGDGEKEKNQPEGFIVDRNFIVAALARYAKDNMSSCTDYTFRYGTDLLYVDHNNRRVLLRNKASKVEEYASYDLLVGADGVRSVVREALVKRHVDMELQVSDIFQTFKAVHLKRPASISPASLDLLPSCLPNGFNGISLPETNDMINLSMGAPHHLFDSVSSDLKSDDVKVVAAYLKANFKAFALDTEEAYLDWATQWVNQRWNRTGQVYCNRYHSLECNIVMMGDSVHATSPSIGMGMNTALRDAQKFNELLDEYDDDLVRVLPRYSIDRVPEGNALTNLAMNLFCFDTAVSTKTTIKGIVRTGLNKFFPKFVDPDPQLIIGMPEYTLSQVYNMAVGQGIIRKHREINMRIRQEFFERQTGMVTEKEKKRSYISLALYLALAGIIAVEITKKVV